MQEGRLGELPRRRDDQPTVLHRGTAGWVRPPPFRAPSSILDSLDRRFSSSFKVSAVPKVVEPASRDGASVFRLVTDGETASVEIWRGSKGWSAVARRSAPIMKMLPASPAVLKQLGLHAERSHHPRSRRGRNRELPRKHVIYGLGLASGIVR